MRHSKSSWSNLNLKDFDRPLNKRGKKNAKLVRELFVTKKVNFDYVLVSSSKRTKKTLQMQAMLPLAQCQAVCWSMPETWVDECNGPCQWTCSRFYYPNNGHCLSAFFIQISCPKPYDNRLGKVHLVDFGGGHLNFKAMPPANTARRTAIFKGRW